MNKCSVCNGELAEANVGPNNWVLDKVVNKSAGFWSVKGFKRLVAVYCTNCGHIEEWKVKNI